MMIETRKVRSGSLPSSFRWVLGIRSGTKLEVQGKRRPAQLQQDNKEGVAADGRRLYSIDLDSIQRTMMMS